MNKRWTIQDLERKGLKIAEKRNFISKTVQKNAKCVIKLPKQESKSLSEMKSNLRLLGYQIICELNFDSKRKYRFDIALPHYKIAIEYEGIFSEKSGHTTVTGYIKDTNKYNLAAVNGWTVLRYTNKNYKQMIPDIESIIATKIF